VILELKCCESLVSEHHTQLSNYLKGSQLQIGLVVNFRHKKLEWKRLQKNEDFSMSREEILKKSMTKFLIVIVLLFFVHYRPYRSIVL
jgi:hypothetical protein